MTEEILNKRLAQIRGEKNTLIAKANALSGHEQEIMFWLEEIKKKNISQIKEVKAE